MSEAREGLVINLSSKSNIINPEKQQSLTNELASLSAFSAIVNKLSPTFKENEPIQSTTFFYREPSALTTIMWTPLSTQ